MKSNQYYTVETIPKYDRIIVETKKKLIPPTQKYMYFKSGGVN
jgi:hypothetical protein